MEHEQDKERRRRLYHIWESYKIYDADQRKSIVGFLGRPTELIAAQRIIDLHFQTIESYGMPRWLGGCEDGEASLDICLILPSESRVDCERYPITGKYKNVGDGWYNLPKIDHSCGCTRFEKNVKHLPGPCKHKIAFQIIVQMMHPNWLAEKAEQNPNYAGKKIFQLYREHPDIFYLFDRSPEIVSLHKKIKCELGKEIRANLKLPEDQQDANLLIPSVVLEERLLAALKERHKEKWTAEKRAEWKENLLKV